ncbi:hypothetical protein ACI6Q2_17640 [Chitinophagaceae bacterium LWZ2-11]
MSKKVLAIYFSQSGQLGEIIERFTAPIIEAGVTVETVRVSMATDYPFPWSAERFFSVMPDCVLSVPGQLAPFQLKEQSYDLIIVGYQAWFLSPSIPFNSLMQQPGFRNVLKDTPVITVTGARNMWISAYERVKTLLKDADAKLVGNIALVDRHANFVSFVTIFHWLLRGKKDRYLNIFPKPGVSDEDIANMSTWGKLILPYINKGEWQGLQAELIAKKALEVKYNLMFIESRARPIFAFWAKFIVKRKNQTAWLTVYKYYLIIALFLGAPVLLLLDAIFIKPFSSKRIKAKKQYYLELN